MFTLVIIVLIYQRYKGRKQIGAISIFITLLNLLEGGLSMARIATLFPFETRGLILCTCFCFENICFFGATWLFVIDYYETAVDLENILMFDEIQMPTYDSFMKTKARKRRMKYIRWTIFALICMLSFFDCFGIKYRSVA